ncbi:unnamed protein product [Phytomonas sp. Hart1]|nr:unnamed protein product [Phytomonas sp. Hart1]|eukprot:CCW69136.1 unnamed protein product [Phytomonas sp. isolate Hart1]
MGKAPPKWLPGERVKETILLQRKSVEQLRADRVLRRDKLKAQRERRKAKIDTKRKKKLTTKKFISAQTILKSAQRKERQGKQFRKIGEKVKGREKRSDKKRFQTYLNDSRVVLLVRAKGSQIPPEVTAAFHSIGLQKLYAARLMYAGNPHTHKLIKQLQPFCIFGHPDREQLDALLRTRGCIYNPETKTRRFISSNLLIERALGAYGVLCIEDIIDTIANRTESTAEVLKRIGPFDFHPPRQLFLERHRSVHQKLEVLNKDSFAAYLANELRGTAKRERKRSASALPVVETKKAEGSGGSLKRKRIER